MQHGSLIESGSFQGDIPILLQSNEAKLVRHCHVTSTALYQPNPSWENSASSEETEIQSQSQEEKSVDSPDEDDEDQEQHSHNGKGTDPALSSVLPDLMQNFGMPGIDLQRYGKSLWWLRLLSMSHTHHPLYLSSCMFPPL
jgi:hypothetical protein